jgi:hypothetical protein
MNEDESDIALKMLPFEPAHEKNASNADNRERDKP